MQQSCQGICEMLQSPCVTAFQLCFVYHPSDISAQHMASVVFLLPVQVIITTMQIVLYTNTELITYSLFPSLLYGTSTIVSENITVHDKAEMQITENHISCTVFCIYLFKL